jgi:hypothetical protein
MGFNSVNAFIRGGGNYLARKQIDKRAVMVLPLNGTGKDVSYFNNAVNLTGTWSSTGGPWNTGYYIPDRNGQLYMPTIDRGSSWSMEAMFYYAGGGSPTVIVQLSTNCRIWLNWLYGCVCDYGSETRFGGGSQYTWIHMAMTCDGTNVRVFVSGILKKTYSVDDTVSSTLFQPRIYSDDPGYMYVSSVRYTRCALHKLINGTYVYPAPQEPFTGYEVL